MGIAPMAILATYRLAGGIMGMRVDTGGEPELVARVT